MLHTVVYICLKYETKQKVQKRLRFVLWVCSPPVCRLGMCFRITVSCLKYLTKWTDEITAFSNRSLEFLMSVGVFSAVVPHHNISYTTYNIPHPLITNIMTVFNKYPIVI